MSLNKPFSPIPALDKFPPAMVILSARVNCGKRGMTLGEIASATGLSLRQIKILAHRYSWRGLQLGTVEALSVGCRVNPLEPKRHVDWFKRRKKAAWRGREKFVARVLKGFLSQKTQGAGQ